MDFSMKPKHQYRQLVELCKKTTCYHCCERKTCDAMKAMGIDIGLRQTRWRELSDNEKLKVADYFVKRRMSYTKPQKYHSQQKVNGVYLYPKYCNICKGQVKYITNDKIYGRKYGSGYAYRCTKCHAYVGTHAPRPKEALGLLACERMRKGKMMCHAIFDAKWQSQTKNKQKKRTAMYCWLSKKLEIPMSECHFGYFDLDRLRLAYKILLEIENVDVEFSTFNSETYTTNI